MTDHSGALFSRSWFVARLAPTVGEEKAGSLLDEALAALGLGGSLLLNREQARKVLDHIAARGGVAGASARLEAARLTPPRPPPPSGTRSISSPPPGIDLPALLASALGLERASAAVAAVCKQLGFDPATLDRTRALKALETLGAEGGLVGVTARFTRARMLLSA